MDRTEAKRLTDKIVSDLRLWLANRLAECAREHGESAIQMRGAFRVDCFVDTDAGAPCPLCVSRAPWRPTAARGTAWRPPNERSRLPPMLRAARVLSKRPCG